MSSMELQDPAGVGRALTFERRVRLVDDEAAVAAAATTMECPLWFSSLQGRVVQLMLFEHLGGDPRQLHTEMLWRPADESAAGRWIYFAARDDGEPEDTQPQPPVLRCERYPAGDDNQRYSVALVSFADMENEVVGELSAAGPLTIGVRALLYGAEARPDDPGGLHACESLEQARTETSAWLEAHPESAQKLGASIVAAYVGFSRPDC